MTKNLLCSQLCFDPVGAKCPFVSYFSPKHAVCITFHVQLFAGTGTPVGDPIEATSLGTFLGQDGFQRYIGSVKTNIGHLESAAGIAGLIKVLLMMKNECIVPSLHFTSPNPKIEFEKFNFTVPVTCCPWKLLSDGRRMACVNSFGFGGSNAHAIITQWSRNEMQNSAQTYRPRILTISGISKNCLKANIASLIKALSEREINLDSLSYTSTCRRDQYPYRAAVHFDSGTNLIKQLQALSTEGIPKKDLQIVLVFCGMGTIWNGMGRELLKEEQFLKAVRDIDGILKGMSDICIEKEFQLQENINDPMIAPLLLFACQVGLHSVWKTWGVRAHAIVGQSVGEVAAAFASGRINLQDAVRVIFYRTCLLSEVKGGRMLIIMNCAVAEVERLCQQFDCRLEISVHYSPESCAVSGEQEDIEAFRAFLESPEFSDKSLTIIPLRVETAFHSRQMDPLVQPLKEKLHSIAPGVQETNIYSSVSGAIAKDTDFVTPLYWSQNLRNPVLFYQALRKASSKNKRNVFVEIGPKPVLAAHLGNIFSDEDVLVLPSMEKNTDISCMLKSLCQLYSYGYDPCWEAVVPHTDGYVTDVPRNEFQRERKLYETDESRKVRDGIPPSIFNHPFVCRVAGDKPKFNVCINEIQTPYIFEHIVRGVIIVPGAFYSEVALAVGYDLLGMPPQTLKVSCCYVQPLVVERKKHQVVKCEVINASMTKINFVILKNSSVYAYGHVEKRQNPIPRAKVNISAIQSRCPVVNTHSEIYEALVLSGFRHGQDLAICDKSFSNSTECLATLTMTEKVKLQIYQTLFHPCILDAMTHPICTIDSEMEQKKVLPAAIASLCVFRALEKQMICYAKKIESSSARTTYNFLLLSLDGVVIAEVEGFLLKSIGQNSNEAEKITYSLKWTESLPTPTKPSRELIMVISDDSKLLNRLITTSSVDQKYIMCHTETNKFDIKNVENLILENSMKNAHSQITGGIDGILFDQSSKYNANDLSGEDLFFTLLQSCNNLKELLLTLSKHNLTLPVTILTRSTQALFSRSQQEINLFGSQFWGMIRSVLKEGLYPFVQLVDISEESEATLSALLGQLTDSSLEKEITIRQGVTFKSAVTFAAENEHVSSFQSSFQTWNGTDDVMLMQHSRKEDEGIFYLQASPRKKSGDITGFRTVKLQNVLLHKKTFFPVTKMSDDEIWQDKDSDDCQVICLEGEGSLIDTDEEVIVCLPIPVSSVVTVPREFVIGRNVFPSNSYRLGVMTLLIVVWKIYRLIGKASYLIITDSSSTDDGKRAQVMLLSYGAVKVDVFQKTNLEKLEICSTTSVVLLTDITQPLMETMLRYDKVRDIIAIDGFHGILSLAKFEIIQTSVKIHTIILQQLFSKSELSQTLPNIVNHLKEKRKLFDDLNSINEGQFTSFSHGSIQISDPSLRVMSSPGKPFKRSSSYLVVGGLGGLGWLTVRWIAMEGAGLVVIVSRKPPSNEMQSKIDDLKQLSGANIVCIQADISDKASIKDGLSQLAKAFPDFSLKGIFHGAGVLSDAFLMRMTPESFEKVCKPKILGTYNLHKLTESLNLDYFLMHSSIVSIAGNAGQSNYGAGNSFMDTFAHYRRSKGLCGQSINWGPLQLGMALTSDDITKQLKQTGFLSLNEEQIINCLSFTLKSNLPQLCFMDFDWADKQRHIYTSPDIRPVILSGVGAAKDKPSDMDVHLVKHLSHTDRKFALLTYLRRVISQILNIDEDEIKTSTVITTFGLDSMLAMTLVNQVRKDLGVRLQLVTLLDGASVEKITEIIDSSILDGAFEDVEAQAVVTAEIPELTVLQETIYDDNKTWKGEKDLVYCAEVYLTIQVPLEWIKAIIMTLMSRQSALRTVYIQDKGVVTTKIFSHVQDFHIFELDSMDEKDLAKEILKVSLVPFDLSSDLPIRVVCAHREGRYNLGFIFHSICFDLASMSVFFQEFREVFIAKISGYSLDAPENVNVAAEINAVLQPQQEELKNFWQSKVNSKTEVNLLTFSRQKTGPQFLHGRYERVSAKITGNLLKKIDTTMVKMNVTLFQLFTSVHQILLHLVSGEKTVALRTTLDTRMHIPALNDVITRGVNGLPLIATVRPNDTIRSFITGNSKEIIQCVGRGLYPYKWIVQDVNPDTLANMSRHSIVLEDMSSLASTRKASESIKLSYRTNGAVKTNHETRLLIWSDDTEKSVKVQLDFMPSLLSSEMANDILDSLTGLLDFIVDNTECQIKDIPESLVKIKDHFKRENSHSLQATEELKRDSNVEANEKGTGNEKEYIRSAYVNITDQQNNSETTDKDNSSTGKLKYLLSGYSEKIFQDAEKADLVIRQGK